MRRRLAIAMVWGGLAFLGAAHQARAQGPDAKNEAGTAYTLGKWKLVNTALFAVALGYLLYRAAPAFFNARSADIQKAIKDATGLKMEADFRSSEIDRKMASLADEVARLRAQSAAEMEREHQRVLAETQSGLTRIDKNVQAEIDAFRQRGERRVRQQTGLAALRLAERRLRPEAGSAEPEELVQDFVRAVGQGNAS